MNIIFAKDFSWHYKDLRYPLTSGNAERAHSRRKSYNAALYEKPICLSPSEYVGRESMPARLPDGQVPLAVIHVKDDYVGVAFLDDRVCVFLDYQYQEFKPGRLFLSQGASRTFFEDNDEFAHGKVWYFKPDGSVVIESGEYHRESHLDVSGHWKAYPAFGQYDHLLKGKWGSLTDDQC